MYQDPSSKDKNKELRTIVLRLEQRLQDRRTKVFKIMIRTHKESTELCGLITYHKNKTQVRKECGTVAYQGHN